MAQVPPSQKEDLSVSTNIKKCFFILIEFSSGGNKVEVELMLFGPLLDSEEH